MRRIAAASILGSLALACSTAANGASTRNAPRLEGTWQVSMLFTVAEGLRDRKVGQRVVETWSFRPGCARGACDVVLRRAGRTITLRRFGSTYRGTASFVGAVTCNGRTYARGTVYVESWVVRVLTSARSARGLRATRVGGIGATVGRSRDSLPCEPIVSREGVELGGVLRG